MRALTSPAVWSAGAANNGVAAMSTDSEIDSSDLSTPSSEKVIYSADLRWILPEKELKSSDFRMNAGYLTKYAVPHIPLVTDAHRKLLCEC